MPEPNETEKKQPPLLPKQRCRFVKVGGEQCRSLAMTGNHHCWHHRWYRKPHFTGVKGYDRVGFLEDVASVQLILSQAMQGLIDRTLDPTMARSLFYGCQVASGLVRLDMAHQRWLVETKQQPEEPVREVSNVDTDPLAPAQEYRGPNGSFEPYWSFTKYMYEQQCEQAGRPKPTCAADMPPSGWMDEEEYFEDPEEWTRGYDEKIKAAHEKAPAADKAAAPSGTAAEPAAVESTATESTTAEPTINESTAAESATAANRRNECHSERSEEPPEQREGLASRSGAPTADLQTPTAAHQNHDRHSELAPASEEPCVSSELQPDPDTRSVDLQAVAAPERHTRNALRGRRAVMRAAHYFLTNAESNDCNTSRNQGCQRKEKGVSRAG